MLNENKQLVIDRLNSALKSLYHNATPNYPNAQNDYEAQLIQDWFQDAASDEIDYINDGGANGTGTSTADFVASKFKTVKAQSMARKFYIKKVASERASYAPWENVRKYGELFQHGRGGRTLAPESLVKSHGASFTVKTVDDLDLNMSSMIELILILESFNSHVSGWNSCVPEQWADNKANSDLQAEIDAHDGMSPHNTVVWR